MIKKLLCKYCSENNEHKNVTIGSILDFIIKTVLIVGTIILVVLLAFFMTLAISNPKASTVNEAIISVLTVWGAFAGVALGIFVISTLYLKSHEIEITRCEREE